MGQFGEELRRERESRGVALETISAKTKVITRYLAALEDERFEVLPGGILSKGIVRGYASTVGLDETAWVERFLAASRQQGVVESEDGWVDFVRNVGRSRASRRARFEMHLRWIGVVMLLLILAGFGWFVWQYVSARASTETPHSVSSALATPPASLHSQP
jgi:cytoskeletal protein RodZ